MIVKVHKKERTLICNNIGLSEKVFEDEKYDFML